LASLETDSVPPVTVVPPLKLVTPHHVSVPVPG
jgi:hypothetical protein